MEARKFVDDYVAKGGAFIAERLRDGYIGELKLIDGKQVIQTERGVPYGTIVAIKTEDSIVTGISYLSPEEKSKPIVGLYIALKRALDGLKEGKKLTETKYIKRKARKQIEHFEKRALSYFHPEVYSYSRGTNPVKYEDYDAIKARREVILKEKKCPQDVK
jgi:hypothetical protein